MIIDFNYLKYAYQLSTSGFEIDDDRISCSEGNGKTVTIATLKTTFPGRITLEYNPANPIPFLSAIRLRNYLLDQKIPFSEARPLGQAFTDFLDCHDLQRIIDEEQVRL